MSPQAHNVPQAIGEPGATKEPRKGIGFAPNDGSRRIDGRGLPRTASTGDAGGGTATEAHTQACIVEGTPAAAKGPEAHGAEIADRCPPPAAGSGEAQAAGGGQRASHSRVGAGGEKAPPPRGTANSRAGPTFGVGVGVGNRTDGVATATGTRCEPWQAACRPPQPKLPRPVLPPQPLWHVLLNLSAFPTVVSTWPESVTLTDPQLSPLAGCSLSPAAWAHGCLVSQGCANKSPQRIRRAGSRCSRQCTAWQASLENHGGYGKSTAWTLRLSSALSEPKNGGWPASIS